MESQDESEGEAASAGGGGGGGGAKKEASPTGNVLDFSRDERRPPRPSDCVEEEGQYGMTGASCCEIEMERVLLQPPPVEQGVVGNVTSPLSLLL